jgi:hypothetical protein
MEGDYHVGQILDALKEVGVDDNTLLVFASWSSKGFQAAERLSIMPAQLPAARSACIACLLPGRLWFADDGHVDRID